MFAVNYKDPRPIYEQIKSGLRQMIREGALQPGSKLPSVRDLAVQLAINPNTIQRAYRDLETEGAICSVPGKGSFVAEDYDAGRARLRELYLLLDETVQKLKEEGICAEDICVRVKNGGEPL